jgi:phage replication-related protein YjqB (UPF0714/DUF867 family)
MSDKYKNFAALKAGEPEDAFRILSRDKGSGVVVAAPHGGGIELGTSEIAIAIAGEDLSFYLFEGKKAEGNKALHITSSCFDEPSGLALMRSAACVLTVHGEVSDAEVVYLGGLNTRVKFALCAALKGGGYIVREHENPKLRGRDAENICNVGRLGAGVQLELSVGLRASFFQSLSRSGRAKPTARLSEFSTLIREAVREMRNTEPLDVAF